ncbi:MAG: hypothetical protein ACYDA5_10370 [Vulcanimicrobiaceae bacterium]
MSDTELFAALEHLRNTMVAVATGGPRIDDANDKFQSTYRDVAKELTSRGIDNPLPYNNLWDWYGRWSSGDLPTYQSRRTYVSEMFGTLLKQVSSGKAEEFEPTGWARVDRTVGEVRQRLASAAAEEQFQAVGLLCREALISVAQAVYEPMRHPPVDGVAPSPTDAKRQLESYLAVELAGGANEEARKHARSALDLSAALQHRRTATLRDAALCVEATTAVINIVAIASGRRDP